MNLVIVAVSIAVGLIPIAAPEFWSEFPSWLSTIMHSGIGAAALVAVVLNMVFNEIRGRRSPSPSVVAAAPDERGNLPSGHR